MQRNILWPDKNMFLKFRPHRPKHSWNKLRTILEEVCYYRSPPPSKCSGHDPTSSPRLPMDEFTYTPRISSGPSNTKVIYHGAVHHWQLILNKKEFKTAKLLKGWMVRGGHERRSDIIRGEGGGAAVVAVAISWCEKLPPRQVCRFGEALLLSLQFQLYAKQEISPARRWSVIRW